jgi:sucrase/ferredoxin-like protein
MTAETCSASSLAADEPLAGSATTARSWLLLEAPGAWGRDVATTSLPTAARAAADAFPGRVQLIRRPGRRDGAREAFRAESTDTGGVLARVGSLADGDDGEPVDGQLVLVCCHGRRDACCARLGTPVFDALRAHVADGRLWQTSHVGGHRFAANVLALPAGILLGRVGVADVGRVAAELASGRIPLEHYRGRTIHPPQAQAADAAVRERLGLAGIGDVRVLEVADDRVLVGTPTGEIEASVAAAPGPPRRESCGDEAAPSARYIVRW